MNKDSKLNQQSRRQFLKSAAVAGTALYFFPGNLFSSSPNSRKIEMSNYSFDYKYRTVSAEHVKEIGEWFEKLKKDGKLSNNETYRKYIGNFEFNSEKVFAGAKSLIIISIPQNIISVTFHKGGKAYEVRTPTGYFSDGLTQKEVQDRIMNEVIKDSSKKIQGGPRLPLKTLAVRSGLAEYGKNNISFVNGGYGSFHRLVGFYTDKIMPDNWGPLKMLQLCKGCSICMKACPTRCITEENFVIDVGKCVTLYNEVPDPMPAWMDPKAHNAMAGCFKCQDTCPANAESIKRVQKLPDITEKETDLILNLKKDKAIEDSIIKKLGGFLSSAEDFPYLSRNLKLVLANTLPKK